MLKSVLISVQPKWCEKIAHIIGRKGNVPIYEKRVEIRKTKPKIETPFKCYIYCTKQFYRKGDGYFQGKYCGKVIGEFVCDRIQEYESDFVDDNCFEMIASIERDDDGDATGFYEWRLDGDVPYINTDFFKKCCVKYEELKKYIGLGINTFYGWHISDFVIYDKPKELSEFFKVGHSEYCKSEWEEREELRVHLEKHNEITGDKAHLNTDSDFENILKMLSPFKMKRPPQSWCYVERKEVCRNEKVIALV